VIVLESLARGCAQGGGFSETIRSRIAMYTVSLV